MEKARDAYLRAGLSQDISVATSAHFNYGNLAAEQARALCNGKPEEVAPDKRKEILDNLSQAIAAYRHCLELKPDHVQSRRNLELIRQWIKYYTDRWNELDRQKRRDESNLMQFLEFLIQTEKGLKATTEHLQEAATADMFAELRRAQLELSEEIPTLREKIATELQTPPDPQAPTGQKTPANSKEIEEGISLLQGWADTAAQKMAAAGRQLGARDTAKSDERTTTGD